LTKIIGVQVHHTSDFRDATRYLVNAAQALLGVANKTMDPDVLVLRERTIAFIQEVNVLEQEARERLRQLWENDPETFVSAREGDIPWPDEVAIDFEARCRCFDRCLVHDGAPVPSGGVTRISPANGAICNCVKTCRQHDKPSGSNIRYRS